ncbi:MAG: hypothetical protein K0S40_3629 [Actinomycetospora sp.]|jgi:hypothetical protein|nr:hypothetical protein [Actinomycetospora sp.]
MARTLAPAAREQVATRLLGSSARHTLDPNVEKVLGFLREVGMVGGASEVVCRRAGLV